VESVLIQGGRTPLADTGRYFVSAFELLIADLETAVQEGQHDKRVAILRQVTDLFVVGAAGFNEEHVDLFGDVLMRLTEQVENRALAELSGKLAVVANAPNAIIQRFARDDEISIAGPVLSHSVRLSESDLIEIAKSKGQKHLGAISERVQLGAAVTDILVERGDTTVVRTLSRNHGAAFSSAGFNALAKRAETDGELAINLGGRVDVPPAVLRELVQKATDAVRTRLMATASPENHAAIQKALGAASKQVAQEASGARDFRRAETLVAEMKNADQLNEQAIAKFAEAGQYEEMVAGLALLCASPIELIDPLVQSPSYDGLLLACKACDIHWPTFSAIISKRFPRRPMSAGELDKARTDFLKLSAVTAKRVFRFWMVRGVAQKN
jgi:uncharacterized protein (DUF2336 family)